MATEYVKIKGKIMWPGNLFMADSYAGNSYFKANLIVDDVNLKKFKASGIRTKVKDQDGEPMVLLKRNVEPKVFDNGDSVGGGRPRVIDEQGNEWPQDRRIGNGTGVIADVSVYGTDLKGHRLESITIIEEEYIPYVDEGRRENDEEPTLVPENKRKKPSIPF